MDAHDLELRQLTYRLFVELGRAPRVGDLAQAMRLDEQTVREGWERLHESHAVVVDLESGELRMANPFSAVPTPHRVRALGESWYANCAWDAFGILAALHADGRIESSCPDCGESISIDVVDGRSSDESLLFHCLVPAQHWWDDIVFT